MISLFLYILHDRSVDEPQSRGCLAVDVCGDSNASKDNFESPQGHPSVRCA